MRLAVARQATGLWLDDRCREGSHGVERPCTPSGHTTRTRLDRRVDDRALVHAVADLPPHPLRVGAWHIPCQVCAVCEHAVSSTDDFIPIKSTVSLGVTCAV